MGIDDDFENGRPRGGISDVMKKALFATIGAVFMTEESVRSYVSDAKLPRDIRNYLIQNTTQAKEQFFAYLSKELSQLILRSDLPKVFEKFLSDHTIELEAKIRFKSNGQPEVSGSAKATPFATPTPAPTQVVPTPVPVELSNGGLATLHSTSAAGPAAAAAPPPNGQAPQPPLAAPRPREPEETRP